MPEGKLNGHLSTTSLPVVWTTKEVEDKNNQHHQYSRRLQFFTTSFSVLSPFLSPSPHQLYLWSEYSPLENCLKEVGWEEVEFTFQGLKFRAFHMNHGLKTRPAAPGGNLSAYINRQVANHGITNGLDRIRVGDIPVKDLVKINKKYKKKVNLTSKDPTFLAEAFVGSQLDHSNIVMPQAFVLADSDMDTDKTGKKFRSLFSFIPREGVGSLKEVSDFLLGQSPELREVILSQIIKGAVKGLEHIHSKGFVYGNFDPSNIIVCEDQKSLTNLTGKLTGFARSCKSGLPRSKLGISTRRKLKHAIKDPSMDLWVLGTFLFSLFTGEPFRDSTKLNDHDFWVNIVLPGVKQWEENVDLRLKQNAKLSSPLKSLIKDLLVMDPSKKFNCSDVLNSQWMKYCGHMYRQNKTEIKKEISNIIRMVGRVSPTYSRYNSGASSFGGSSSQPSSIESRKDLRNIPGSHTDEFYADPSNEFDNRISKLFSEMSYQSFGSQNSVVGINSFDSGEEEESETSSGQLNNSNNFNRSELSIVSTTSNDAIPVKKIRCHDSAFCLSQETKNKYDDVIHEMKGQFHLDYISRGLDSISAPELNDASVVNGSPAELTDNLSTSSLDIFRSCVSIIEDI